MFWRKKKKTDSTAESWGIKEVKPSKGVIYHAHGRLKQSAGFTHVMLLSPARTANFTALNDDLNRSVVAAIQRDERRERLRGAAGYLFGDRPNYAISFSAYPNVGERRRLLERGLYISYPGYSSTAIAVTVCRFMVATAEDVNYSSLEWLIREDFFTCQFWHNCALVGYTRAIFGDER